MWRKVVKLFCERKVSTLYPPETIKIENIPPLADKVRRGEEWEWEGRCANICTIDQAGTLKMPYF